MKHVWFGETINGGTEVSVLATGGRSSSASLPPPQSTLDCRSWPTLTASLLLLCHTVRLQ